jgi:hypothetical protein
MAQELLRQEKLATGPAPYSDEFPPAAKRTGRVDVIHGVYAHSLPLSGMTVKQARTELEERMNIDPESVAVIDGVEAGEDVVLRESQVLSFITPAGEKG